MLTSELKMNWGRHHWKRDSLAAQGPPDLLQLLLSDNCNPYGQPRDPPTSDWLLRSNNSLFGWTAVTILEQLSRKSQQLLSLGEEAAGQAGRVRGLTELL